LPRPDWAEQAPPLPLICLIAAVILQPSLFLYIMDKSGSKVQVGMLIFRTLLTLTKTGRGKQRPYRYGGETAIMVTLR